MRHGFLIPVYNHGATLEKVVLALEEFGLPIIVVDDGNNFKNKTLIESVASSHKSVTLVRNFFNRGKGYSVCRGIQKARKMGITHLFQIDADGQHDAQNTCREFLEASKKNPDALICGFPVFDSTVPEKRLKAKAFCNRYARYLIRDKTCRMIDSMCGYRIYPVEPFCKAARFAWIDSHMGFDTEILVRLIWNCVPIIYKKVRVTYPAGGVSNFHTIRDNIHISFMFTRLSFKMWFMYLVLNKQISGEKISVQE